MILNRLSLIALCAAIALSGCSLSNVVFRPDINQGNFITQKEINMLKVGMTKEQVKFIMGSPILNSIYEDNVWYYVFRELPTYKKVSQQMYIITFNNLNTVSRIEHSEFGKSNVKQMDHQAEIEFTESD